jgi:SagB-type dehydrogenase family enzyme
VSAVTSAMSLVTSATCVELFALRKAVYSATRPNGDFYLATQRYAESLGRLSAGVHTVLRCLVDREHTRDELVAIAQERDGDPGAEGVARLLDQLRVGGWLKITVAYQGRALYTLDPLRPPPAPQQVVVESSRVLSRFALLRRDDEGLLLESPRAWCDIRVHDPAVLGVLGSPADPQASALPAEAAHRVIHDLCWAQMAVPTPNPEDTELRLRQWRPHELWFHDRSRLGPHAEFGENYGGTYWARDRFDPLPARPEPFAGPALDLHQPDLEALRRTDPTLTTVLEDRRTIRVANEDNPITAKQLGEFLYRCARNRKTIVSEGVEYISRPYPAGGGTYELEVYPLVRHVAGLEPGLYHYDSHEHQLRLVREISHPAVRRTLTLNVPFGQGPAQVLLVISARVGRVMWKYEEMAYALVLKHVGVLYQTMYLVATAMGLAPCGLGAGDAEAFTNATGRDPLQECSVAEFALSSRPPDPPNEFDQLTRPPQTPPNEFDQLTRPPQTPPNEFDQLARP